MNPLTFADFECYFREVHGTSPYDWQERLAEKAVTGAWPSVIDLPTGSGKTACIDIAVFALACQSSLKKAERTAPRRIFFCVNRRVIVDEAHQRARHIAEKLRDAETGAFNAPTLVRVAAGLRQISTLRRESAPPLDVLELRGGIYRDNRWARSITQPTIVCTTIDQLGSRLLFRGYGVSPNATPIQAALIAYDSLVLLDEAHISRPFLQTLDFVKRYLDPVRWTKQQIGVRPMTVVPMTATPPECVSDVDVIRLDTKDRDNVGLDNRLKASKSAELLSVPNIVQSAVEKADKLAKDAPTAVGIIVNRVATAKAIYQLLREKHPDALVELVIGSMRPVDRDQQAKRLRSLVGPDRPKPRSEKTSFVVATQCLEVGADYDFDALITECASLDALRQRFGRLNRGGREIDAKAVILIDASQEKEETQLDDKKPLDPIYGNALSRTWNWLNAHAAIATVEPGTVSEFGQKKKGKKKDAGPVRLIDFGIDAFKPLFESISYEDRLKLSAPSASLDAPIMLPAYVDVWCQTSPRPTPDPEVSLFIHGPQSGEPDVQVCWRADLFGGDPPNRSDWCDIVGLLPPTSAECMSVPISRLRRWLADGSDDADQGDLLGARDQAAATDEAKKSKDRQNKRLSEARVGVLWRGARDSKLIRAFDDLKPADTLVLPTSAEGWNELGHVPNAMPETIDVAEQAFRTARDLAALRLHPSLKTTLQLQMPAVDLNELLRPFSDTEARASIGDLKERLEFARSNLDPEASSAIVLAISNLSDMRFDVEYYPDHRGAVLISRKRLNLGREWFPCVDDGEDERSRASREISLTDHTQHVHDKVMRTIDALPFDDLCDVFRLAADWHDLGKADERFQAVLRQADRSDHWFRVAGGVDFLAKSKEKPESRQAYREACKRAGLPEGFRHEMLSVQIVEHGKLKDLDDYRSLVLHLIAAHHGYARPFAPIVPDPEPPDVSVDGVTLSTHDRLKMPSHRIDSGIADRFWTLTRCYGWWGLAYLEAILRLADQQASADEDSGIFEEVTT